MWTFANRRSFFLGNKITFEIRIGGFKSTILLLLLQLLLLLLLIQTHWFRPIIGEIYRLKRNVNLLSGKISIRRGRWSRRRRRMWLNSRVGLNGRWRIATVCCFFLLVWTHRFLGYILLILHLILFTSNRIESAASVIVHMTILVRFVDDWRRRRRWSIDRVDRFRHVVVYCNRSAVLWWLLWLLWLRLMLIGD